MNDLKIISISGKPGLYKLLTSTKSGIIAESIPEKKRVMSPFTHISALNEIAIYTYSEEIPLWKVFKAIADKETYKPTISHKTSKQELESYLREVLPEFDEDRVYPSHIKKIVQWYNILASSDILKEYLEEKEAEEKSDKTEEE